MTGNASKCLLALRGGCCEIATACFLDRESSRQCPTRPKRDHVRSVRAIAASLPPPTWQLLQLRAGAYGPSAFAFARLRVWAVRHRRPGPASWLIMRRSLEPDAEVKYYLSTWRKTSRWSRWRSTDRGHQATPRTNLSGGALP